MSIGDFKFSVIIIVLFNLFFIQKKNQRVKALNLSISLTAKEKDQYRQFMTIDYMSSEHSMSESSDEGEANDEDGYESPDLERPKEESF